MELFATVAVTDCDAPVVSASDSGDRVTLTAGGKTVAGGGGGGVFTVMLAVLNLFVLATLVAVREYDPAVEGAV